MNDTPKLVRNTGYYWTSPVYEFNLPAGTTCPFAKECKIVVGENCGKFLNDSASFRCYAASAERFPSARASRWANYRGVLRGIMPDIHGCANVRIHMSGDFFSQAYFDQWLSVASSHGATLFWAFTKSLNFWMNRRRDIPKNLMLTASAGGHHDWMISEYGLKCATVFRRREEIPNGMPIDTDDYYAAHGADSFALLDNHCKRESVDAPNDELRREETVSGGTHEAMRG